MKLPLFLAAILLTALVACNDSKTSKMTENTDNNPLLVESTLPYGAPDFSNVRA